MKKVVFVWLMCMSVLQVWCADTREVISEKALYRKYGSGHLSLYVAETTCGDLSNYNLQDVIEKIKDYLRPKVMKRYVHSYTCTPDSTFKKRKFQKRKFQIKCIAGGITTNNYVASGDGNGVIKIWNTTNGTCLSTLKGRQRNAIR